MHQSHQIQYVEHCFMEMFIMFMLIINIMFLKFILIHNSTKKAKIVRIIAQLKVLKTKIYKANIYFLILPLIINAIPGWWSGRRSAARK